jgi:hypothetical protein
MESNFKQNLDNIINIGIFVKSAQDIRVSLHYQNIYQLKQYKIFHYNIIFHYKDVV